MECEGNNDWSFGTRERVGLCLMLNYPERTMHSAVQMFHSSRRSSCRAAILTSRKESNITLI